MTLDTVPGEMLRALRAQHSRPLHCFASIVILAVGIGAATSVFTFVNALLLVPLPVAEPDRLVRIWKVDSLRGFDHVPLTYPEYVEWSRRASTLESVATTLSRGPWTDVLENDGATSEPDRPAGAPQIRVKINGRAFLPRPRSRRRRPRSRR